MIHSGTSRPAALAAALLATGFAAETSPVDFCLAAWTAQTDRAHVLVRLKTGPGVPANAVVVFTVCCPRCLEVSWAATFSAAAPSPVIVTAASAALSAPLNTHRVRPGSANCTPVRNTATASEKTRPSEGDLRVL